MNPTIETMLAFVHDEHFAALWRKSCEQSMTWEMFYHEPVPKGYTIEEAYAIITALRRRFSISLPFDNYIMGVKDPFNWFCMTNDMHTQLTDLVAQSRSGSALDIHLNEYVKGHSRVLLLLDEYLSLARRDGLAIRADDVRSVWSRMRMPATPEEHLAANFSSLIAGLDSYMDRRITYGLIEELHEKLLAGVAFEQEPTGCSRIAFRKDSLLEDPSRALETVAELAQGRGCCERIHPVFRSMLISGVFWEFFPFSSANAILELVVRALFYTKEGLPALGWVSFSCISERWEQGTLSEPKVLCRYLEMFPDCGEGFDATSHFASELQLMLYELERLRERLSVIDREDRDSRAILERERYLNRRQRDVLIFSLRNPGCQFTIADHKRLYGIVYATARQDLMDLVDMGFLSQFVRGRAFVFEATPRFFAFVQERRKVLTGSDV